MRNLSYPACEKNFLDFGLKESSLKAMGLPDLNTIAEMVGLVASLIGIWEFVRRSLFKKIRFSSRTLLKRGPLEGRCQKALPKEPAFIQFLKFKFGQPLIIKEGPFAGLKATLSFRSLQYLLTTTKRLHPIFLPPFSPSMLGTSPLTAGRHGVVGGIWECSVAGP